MNSTPSPAVNGQKSAAGPPGDPTAFVLRCVVSVALLIAYFAGFDPLLAALGRIVPADLPPKVVAVTLLTLLLVAVWWKTIKGDVRFYAPIFITYILAVSDAAYGILDNFHSEWLARLTNDHFTSYSPTFVAIIATVLIELALALHVRQVAAPGHAYITGISVGILIKSTELWPFVLCGVISIVSKYALRYRGRHLWNPSNFGVTVLLWLGGTQLGSLSVQSGNDYWPILLIWLFGSLILYRLGRLYLPVVFIAAFVPLAFLRSRVTQHPFVTEVAPVTWPMFQLYIFFMITDPRTTTRARWSQCAVVVLVAIVDTVLRLGFRDVHSLYHALFIIAPLTNLAEILWDRRRADEKKRQTTAIAAPAGVPATAFVTGIKA